MTLVVLATDALVYLLVIFCLYILIVLRKNSQWKEAFGAVFLKPQYRIAVIILAFFCIIGFLDTIHFRNKEGNQTVKSVLDVLLSPRFEQFEKTYSAPFALRSFTKEATIDKEGRIQLNYIKLKFAGQNLKRETEKWQDITWRAIKGISLGVVITFLLYKVFHLRSYRRSYLNKTKPLDNGCSKLTAWLTIGFLMSIIMMTYQLMCDYHIMGTNKVGQDVFYIALKSIRTGLVIGTLTTFIMLPFALFFGMWAGYFKGWVDSFIQYIYTTLSSIPGVLLIAAAIVSLQSKMQQNPDLRLLVLCIILGVTSWTGLCRLIRGETLKLRESEFVKAAYVLGSRHTKIILKHILPNLMHIIIISIVLDFSGLVLAEAVLSYVGVGVDASTYSFGNMINAARFEMAREPMIWWSLLCAFILMFALVFSANIVSDGVQEALNPKRT